MSLDSDVALFAHLKVPCPPLRPRPRSRGYAAGPQAEEQIALEKGGDRAQGGIEWIQSRDGQVERQSAYWARPLLGGGGARAVRVLIEFLYDSWLSILHLSDPV